jgi:uncharacterized protein
VQRPEAKLDIALPSYERVCGSGLRIGLLSDTHVPDDAPELPMAELTRAFSDVDLIMHAGDIYDLRVLEDLSSIAPVIAAFGDDDFGSTIRDDRVQYRQVVRLEGHCIWLIHERPKALRQHSSDGTLITNHGQLEAPDVVVFGHEHRTIIERHERVLLVNPGSPTFLNYKPGLGTAGILTLSPHHVGIKIIDLSK